MTIASLPVKKKGRPLLLDVAVQHYVLGLKEVGCPVKTDITIAAARGIV